MTKVFHFFIYVVNLPSFMICYTIIIIKPDDDVLQGVNKLDYLLKVSIFQMYKRDFHFYKLGIIGVMFRDVEKSHIDPMMDENNQTLMTDDHNNKQLTNEIAIRMSGVLEAHMLTSLKEP